MTEPSANPEIPHAEAKAAGLLLLTLLLVLAFVGYVMQARGVFDDNQHLLLVAENAEGVAVGNDLSFSGFPIGRVTRIELGDDGKAHIHIDVPLRDARWLRSSSVFTLERGVVGGARLRAYSGVLDDPQLEDGARRDVLIGDAASGVSELVATMHKLIDNVARLTAEESALSATLANLQQFSATLNGRHGALGALLGNERDVARVLAALEESRALLVDARASLNKLDAALVDVKAITGNARAASEDLDALRAEVDLNLRKVSGMVDELNRKWPFARERELKLP
ncbi:phospholipid/cholesterol/gamma-HCH transport system substrate-binding protein [Azonexus fungiphilus]|uniref:Phospholipid/cholesterol/gamma-HCH transport system substrate-binding protein n=1 Tax=Azonexus fungiphilus TaxID=146940 RepID=A0A495VR76_9RHOO|nr:MlaD family protein [Azonexus fungiphilus]RKT51157.1 phospholipid/cholesterol/gamma-HCH transport system substrate-binding protein [Azonexus fungiphilus]